MVFWPLIQDILTPNPCYVDPPNHGISNYLPMAYWTPYPWYFDPLPMAVWSIYPWYFDPSIHGMLTPLAMIFLPPFPWYIDPVRMVFWPIYPWYLDPSTHGILTPNPCYVDPPNHGISNPLPMVFWPTYRWYFDPLPISWFRGSRYHGGSICHTWGRDSFSRGGPYTMDVIWLRGQSIMRIKLPYDTGNICSGCIGL